MSRKEIHFYTYVPFVTTDFKYFYWSWKDAVNAITNNYPFIYTLQIGLLSTGLIESGYKIYIHNNDDDIYEIKNMVKL